MQRRVLATSWPYQAIAYDSALRVCFPVVVALEISTVSPEKTTAIILRLDIHSIAIAGEIVTRFLPNLGIDCTRFLHTIYSDACPDCVLSIILHASVPARRQAKNRSNHCRDEPETAGADRSNTHIHGADIDMSSNPLGHRTERVQSRRRPLVSWGD